MADSPDYDMQDEEGGCGSGETSQHDEAPQPQQQPKRTRVLLSCAPCRISKLKCDRASPCGNCLKKDRVDLCEYAPRPKKPTKPTKGMAARLRRLEAMLREMMDDDSAGAAAAMSKFGVSSAELSGAGMDCQLPLTRAAAADVVDGTDGTDGTDGADPRKHPRKGRVVRGQRATTYVGATHFMAMLDDIDDLKAYFDDPQDELDDGAGLEASAEFAGIENLVMGAGGSPPGRLRTKGDLLRMMPPRSVADRLITRFFNSHTPSHHVLHRPTFTKQYKAFWNDVASVDPAFLAVVFVILELGIHFFTFSSPHELALDGTGTTPVARYRAYRAAASCALTLTTFTSPSTATLQAMVIFIEAEFLVNRVSQTNCYLLLGVCIRIMLKMGLHRDPDRLPTISAFEGEIRRRLWNLAIQLDLVVSFYLGLPSMIDGIPSDTGLAHNLLDDDFDEHAAALPPSRPDTEYTTMSYTIFKSMVCRVFGHVARLAHALTPPSYADVMRTDAMLEDTWRQVPPFIKVRPVDDCVADAPLLVVQRFGLASLYQRSRCVLHRPYLLADQARPEHAYSRRACLQSALALLAYHQAVHDATQPGAVLHQTGWFIKGLGMHDFLLAAVIVFIIVQNESKFAPELLASRKGSASSANSANKDNSPSTASSTTATTASTTSTTKTSHTESEAPANYGSHASLPVERGVLVDMLRRSYAIWAQVAQTNSDAVKAAELVGVMLRKIYANDVRKHGCAPNWSPPADPRGSQPRSQPSSTHNQPTQEPSPQDDAGYALATDYYGEPATTGMMSLPSLGMDTPMPYMAAPLGLLPTLPTAPTASTQTGFSRCDLVPSMPPGPMQAGAMETGTLLTENAPTRYDAWIPLHLDDINWNTVDTGIRVSSQPTNEWTTADSVLADINYAASSLWDHPGL